MMVRLVALARWAGVQASLPVARRSGRPGNARQVTTKGRQATTPDTRQENAGARSPVSPAELTALLGFMMGLSAFSIDAMLPALHDLAVAFQTSDTRAQLVVNLYFFGFAAGQIVFGPLSDRFGRRSLLSVSATGFFLCALALVFAPSLGLILVLRFLQGVFGAALRVVGTALVRDVYRGEAMARVLSFAMLVLLVAPLFAPSLGVLLLRWGWRAPFGMIAAISAFLTVWLVLRLPESLPPERRRPLQLGHLRRAWQRLLQTPPSLAFTVILGCSYGMLYAYLASSAQLYKEHFGLSNALFALAFAGTGLAQVLGTVTNGLVITRLGLRRVLPPAVVGLSLVSVSLLGVAALGVGVLGYWLLMSAAFFGIALIFSNANSAALEPLGDIAGFASSVIGFTSTVLANLFGLAIGQLAQGSPAGLALGFFLLSLGNVLALAVALRAGWRRASEPSDLPAAGAPGN
ncbi:multidrug effflux MFS transporter [Thermomicrobiaceae bacterium CFH 74404]|uniref:Multidrug effflux MFS transporter n=1 Tax=Thermalbibacter longus TaxID=2951981 RepID=A0AA41WB19_9BACT|nr:multidrug effflux MFS transporter [Thermalbibacter longus]MCM8748207.1 multidrug effflux MFS transporter [Thermalbibacter longus]